MSGSCAISCAIVNAIDLCFPKDLVKCLHISIGFLKFFLFFLFNKNLV